MILWKSWFLLQGNSGVPFQVLLPQQQCRRQQRHLRALMNDEHQKKNDHHGNSCNSTNNNNNKEQTITGAPSLFFVSTLFYKQRLGPRVLFCPPPLQQPICKTVSLFLLVSTNKDWGPVCCSDPPPPSNNHSTNKDWGPVCCSDPPPSNNPLTRWCWIDDHSHDDVE